MQSAGGLSLIMRIERVLPSQRIRILRRLMIVTSASTSLVVGTLIISLAREAFIADGVIYLEQSQRAIAPYLNDDQRITLNSSAAQMKSRLDFDKLNAEIQNVAQAHKVQLPEFKPF